MDTQVITPSAILVAQVIEIEKGGSVESITVEHPPTATEGWFVVKGTYKYETLVGKAEAEIIGAIDPDGNLAYLLVEKTDKDPFEGLI